MLWSVGARAQCLKSCIGSMGAGVKQSTNITTANWVPCTNLIGNGLPCVFQTPLSGTDRKFFRVRIP